MNKTLKFIVVSLGILIIILLIFTIFALISKYKKSDNLDYQNLILTPLVSENYQIVSFQINNKEGVIQTLSLLPLSYPGHSLLTEDEGSFLGEDDCSCGRYGKYFKIYGRVKNAELRGCSDTYES